MQFVIVSLYSSDAVPNRKAGSAFDRCPSTGSVSTLHLQNMLLEMSAPSQQILLPLTCGKAEGSQPLYCPLQVIHAA